MKYSHSEDDGVIGYHATTVAPPIRAPSAAAWLPSTRTLPSTLPVIASRRYGSCFEKLSCQWSYPTLIASRLTGTALGLGRNWRLTPCSRASHGMPSTPATTPT